MKNRILIVLFLCLGILVGTVGTLYGLYYLSTHDIVGTRLLFFLKQPSQQQVVDRENFISYLLPVGFKKDSGVDLTKKFGADYISGFHHIYDARIGCEVRKEMRGIELVRQVYQEKTKTNSIINTSRGIQFNYFLVDPLSATQIMTTLLVPKNEGVSYVLTCGAGRAYHALYAHDFANFFNSFSFVQ
ncbi:MAG: hypothetical protein AAB893_00330 [Patescibacteria group bacterium]